MKMYASVQKLIRHTGRIILPATMIMVVLVLSVGFGSGGTAAAQAPAKESAIEVQINVYEVTRESYVDRAIAISFPQITKMNDAKKQYQLNQILRSEALSILQDYGKDDLEKLTVKLDY